MQVCTSIRISVFVFCACKCAPFSSSFSSGFWISFIPTEGEESEEAEPEAERLPEYLLHLHADKEVLINRILRKPEAEVAGTHDTEEGGFFFVFRFVC